MAPPIPLAKQIVKKVKNPKIAIVIDDFGYNMNNLRSLFAIGQPVTLSILPDLRYSERISDSAIESGYEVILHLPLEAHRKDIEEERDTIRSGMTEAEITARLEKEIASIHGLTGVSNHMGSKATEDMTLMTAIFKYLKKRNLYFFDSLTSEKSVCRETARAVGIPYARRDIFLDNSNNTADIEKEMSALTKLAFKRGSVIAICHDRKNTIAVLAKTMPDMAAEGVRFVSLSEMVKKGSDPS